MERDCKRYDLDFLDRWITMLMHAKSDLRVFSKRMIADSGSVLTVAIRIVSCALD